MLATVMANLASVQFASAAPSQVGAQQVTINPGGGILDNASDGIRFTINSDEFEREWDEDANDGEGAYIGNEWDEAVEGQDGVVYRGTYQYCCTAGGPMLNIGGTLYGQAGPAGDYYSDEEEDVEEGEEYMPMPAAWNSIQIVSTTGATATGARTNTTGSGSATVRYTVVHEGLTYTVNRTVSYVYPNNYVTDTYSYTIPTGNTKDVKFYLGGDTAPGSDDQGYGIMLSQPMRTIISLNPESEIMFGFREVPGSKKFNGATSQSYGNPYDAVYKGQDIGFVVELGEEPHDAGLMMQWNLGSTPGTYTHSLQQFVGSQAANLTASFGNPTAGVNGAVKLNLSVENTLLDEVDGLGYTFTLPAGLVVAADGVASNGCGGTVTATAGGSTVTVANATVESATNCVTSVKVSAAAVGTYTIGSNRVSGLAGGLQNAVGTSSLEVVEANAENDKNGDGLIDTGQSNVTAMTNNANGKTVVLEVDDQCAIDTSLMKAEADNDAQDVGFSYPEGLLNFNVDCGDPGYTTTVKQYYYDTPMNNYVLRKHNPNTGAYFTISDGTVTQQTVYGQNVLLGTYQVTDGGELDIDGEANGIIVDPAGLALAAVTSPNTGFGTR